MYADLPTAKWTDKAILSIDNDHSLRLWTSLTPGILRKLLLTDVISMPLGVPINRSTWWEILSSLDNFRITVSKISLPQEQIVKITN